ncbi:hypothetical protein SAMN05518849_101460 [Sphingobium sp. AP50]|uniref:hypothetical protein n=1 Tax=Sphingobium sp. AP50 TaxID=1884369 RepID=UPI0008B91941|nr:hypothetical protein [Sphingobium sp. AP50]SEI66063.1 hypothetical protein SAMN05518849_101460 [Sphingobium sp. AP50]
MYKALYCNRCRTRLTSPLDIRPAIESDSMRGLSKDGQDIAPQGVAYLSDRIAPWLGRYHGPLSFVPQYWLNPNDLADTVSDSADSRLTAGCCGVAGFNGPNQICRCKAVIGTLHDDCMWPSFFIPEPATTTMRDMTDDYWNYE